MAVAIEWPRGKVLGGSSSLNGLLYVRGQPQDYDRWRQMGNVGWGWDDVLPYFKRVGGSGARRGRLPWRRRPADGLEYAAAATDLRCLGRGGAERRLQVQSRL